MEWTRGPVIGRGSSATVSIATVPSGERVAVKSTDLSCSSLLQNEKCIISQLNSHYVVKYLGFDITCEENKPMYNLFMEYAPGGTLSDLIKYQGGCLNESLIQLFVYQILHGLDYLHSNGVVHCDIKGQNILIGEDGLKIADFGCAKLIQHDEATRSSFSGTPVFMAPEVARGEEQGFPADVWALGCTIIEMATGSNPWPDVNDPVSAVYRIGYADDVPELPTWFSSDGKQFLSYCLRREAKERWTAEQLLQHPFFNGLTTNSKVVIEPERSSPTSILDQGIWDSFEASEASPMPAAHHVSTVTSPADRIGRLTGDVFSSGCLNLPDWAEDEGWVTVRGIQEEIPTFSGQNCGAVKQDCEGLMEDTEPFIISSSVGENELESSVAMEDSLVDYFTDDISFVISSLIADTDVLLSCESVIHVLVTRTIDFECKLEKNFITSFTSICQLLRKGYICIGN